MSTTKIYHKCIQKLLVDGIDERNAMWGGGSAPAVIIMKRSHRKECVILYERVIGKERKYKIEKLRLFKCRVTFYNEMHI
jgi:hypothetical protein